MKRKILLFGLLFSFGLGFAQTEEELTPEEKERRERNIQAGNPFKKYGYTPKIATLSKGKYLEWHDLDSIVRIGSYSYHVKKKDITGYNIHEDKNSEATLRPELTSRWLSPDPLAEEFPSWSPYNFVYNNPIRYTDPDGRAPFDWIKNNLTGKITWDNNVTSASNTPENHTYIGKSDQSLVTNLFGKSNFRVSDWDVGLISLNDFNNPYSAKGASFNNMSAKTTMSVSLNADVSTTYNSDGSIQSKEFNGVDVNVSVSGRVVAPYANTNIKLFGETNMDGTNMTTPQSSANGEIIQGGDVPTLTFRSSISSQTIQSQFRSPTQLNVNFSGQYSNNGFPMSYPGAFGLLGLPNPTNLSTSLPLNNTANPNEINRTNN